MTVLPLAMMRAPTVCLTYSPGFEKDTVEPAAEAAPGPGSLPRVSPSAVGVLESGHS